MSVSVIKLRNCIIKVLYHAWCIKFITYRQQEAQWYREYSTSSVLGLMKDDTIFYVFEGSEHVQWPKHWITIFHSWSLTVLWYAVSKEHLLISIQTTFLPLTIWVCLHSLPCVRLFWINWKGNKGHILPSNSLLPRHLMLISTEPCECPYKLHIARTQSWATFLSLIVWICLHLHLRDGLRKMHIIIML